ncbi:MAG: hypothetical protein A2787_00350 [Omnitrophica WOR_2 bacterium RIFCSPHIGHO2_01_FULL_48_9]|nr:MAG: hypothetical protein A3D10_06555 [Omnitrophica WOR_2 bacterium RIFCSPHIGHO2_02_FULL_48_11]OGX33097.1 MAG: hypothetical protein A2787_00350 [Omnitrophica WOR_2 bacterium RIFCSPHIGHO2_01_FULL_48_9]
MLLNPLTFHTPTTISQAAELYSTLGGARILAGGTFLLNSLKLLKRKGLKTPKNVISLKRIPELVGMTADSQGLTIGSMTTIDEIFESPLLKDNFQVLRIVCRNISTQPIRNVATLGGNLTCRYTWTEMPAVMIGLEAQLHFIDNKGQASSLSAEEFYKAAAKTDKILTHVRIPRDTKAAIAYRRARKSSNVDIPLLSLLIKTYFEGNRFTKTHVSVNNCVAFAQRDQVLEQFLNAAVCSKTIAQEALDHLDKNIYDNRSDEYKQHIFRISIKGAIEELITKQAKKS